MDIANITVNVSQVIAAGFIFFSSVVSAVWFISNKLVKKHICTYRMPDGILERIEKNEDNIVVMQKEIIDIKLSNASMKEEIKSIKETTVRIEKQVNRLVESLLTGVLANQKN